MRQAEKRSWRTQAGDRQQRPANVARCFHVGRKTDKPNSDPPWDAQVKAGDGVRVSRRWCSLSLCPNLVYKPENNTENRPSDALIRSAELCSHIARLWENIWLGVCSTSTDMKSTQ